jgi:hypothetical protein
MAHLGEVFPLGNFHGTIVGVSQCKLEGPALAEFVTEASQLKQKQKEKAKVVVLILFFLLNSPRILHFASLIIICYCYCSVSVSTTC